MIPDSYRSNFRPFYLQPPSAFLSFCSLLWTRDRSRNCRSPATGRFPVLASPQKRRARQCIWPNRVQHCFVYGLVFRFRCSPPRLSTTQLPSATDRPVFPSGRDFHPSVGAYFQAHLSWPLRAKDYISSIKDISNGDSPNLPSRNVQTAEPLPRGKTSQTALLSAIRVCGYLAKYFCFPRKLPLRERG